MSEMGQLVGQAAQAWLDTIERKDEAIMHYASQVAELQAENARLRAVLSRLVELSEDDGGESDMAWKDAYAEALAALDGAGGAGGEKA